MKTLIFKTVKDLNSRFGNTDKTEFVKEGSFTDAMIHFDDQYPLFPKQAGEEGFDSSIDAKGYITDSSGEVLFTYSELEDSDYHSVFVDGGFFRGYYTTASNDLTEEELIAVSGSMNAEEYFMENGFSERDFKLAEYFNDFKYLVLYGDLYIDDFKVSDGEPDEDYFEFNGKFYTKN